MVPESAPSNAAGVDRLAGFAPGWFTYPTRFETDFRPQGSIICFGSSVLGAENNSLYTKMLSAIQQTF
jgi:hypothetical protein